MLKKILPWHQGIVILQSTSVTPFNFSSGSDSSVPSITASLSLLLSLCFPFYLDLHLLAFSSSLPVSSFSMFSLFISSSLPIYTSFIIKLRGFSAVCVCARVCVWLHKCVCVSQDPINPHESLLSAELLHKMGDFLNNSFVGNVSSSLKGGQIVKDDPYSVRFLLFITLTK